MDGCDGVIHAAAMYEVGIPASQRPAMWEANVAGTERVLSAALAAGVPKVVYVSTVGAFGNTHRRVVDESYEHPGKEFTSYYEETKLEAHRIAKRMIAEQGLPGVIVQPGGVYGPGDTSSIAALLEQFFAGRMPLLPFPELGICLSHVERHRRRDHPGAGQGRGRRELRAERAGDHGARRDRGGRRAHRPQGPASTRCRSR